VEEGLIDLEIKKKGFLDVYEPRENGPWRKEGKRFVCGYTRQDIVKERETYLFLSWLCS